MLNRKSYFFTRKYYDISQKYYDIKQVSLSRSTPPEVSLGKSVLKICSKFKENTHAEVRFQTNFIEIALRHGCSPVNLLHNFRTPFPKNTSEGLRLSYISKESNKVPKRHSSSEMLDFEISHENWRQKILEIHFVVFQNQFSNSN